MTIFKYVFLVLDILTILFFIYSIFIQYDIYYYLNKLNNGITKTEYYKLKQMITNNIVNLIIFFLFYVYNLKNYNIKKTKLQLFNLYIFILYIITFIINIYLFSIVNNNIYYNNNDELWKYKDNIKIYIFVYVFPLFIIILNLFYNLMYFFNKYLNYKIKQLVKKKHSINKIYEDNDLIYNFISYNKLKNNFKK
jgi:hypothetical protein